MHRPRTMSCIVARSLGQAGSSMREIPHGATAIALILFATGCDPIVSVQGSFFPAWMLCIVIGIGLTVPVRYLFILTRLEPHLAKVGIGNDSGQAFFQSDSALQQLGRPSEGRRVAAREHVLR